MRPYGFTHGRYLPTIDPGWVHVGTRDTTIVREVWRLYHEYKAGDCVPRMTRGDVKGFIRKLLAKHHDHQLLVERCRL